MRIVVTGATGLTGGAIASELLRQGHQIVGTSRRPTAAGPAGVEMVTVDLRRTSALAGVVARADALVHVAGILFGEGVAAAGIERLGHVVVMSTAGIYSRSQGSRALYLRNEHALRSVVPDALFVRPTMIYGSTRDRNVHRIIRFARRWRVLPLPDGGRSRIQPIHYRDLATVTASLFATGASGVVDAGGPRPVTLAEAARTIVAALRRPTLLVPLPVAVAIGPARILDRAIGSRWAERLERTREDRVVDNARVLGLTGVQLRSFEDGVREEIAEMARA